MKGVKIAIVGHALSGKDEVAKHLEQRHGFKHVSTGHLVREYIAENDLGEPVRELMIKIANEVRALHRPDFFLKKALDITVDCERVVISGLRAVGEIDAFKKVGGIIISCDAAIELRYERAMSRQRASDRITFEEFKAHQADESSSNDLHSQNIEYAISNVDYAVTNENTLSALQNEIDSLVSLIDNSQGEGLSSQKS